MTEEMLAQVYRGVFRVEALVPAPTLEVKNFLLIFNVKIFLF